MIDRAIRSLIPETTCLTKLKTSRYDDWDGYKTQTDVELRQSTLKSFNEAMLDTKHKKDDKEEIEPNCRNLDELYDLDESPLCIAQRGNAIILPSLAVPSEIIDNKRLMKQTINESLQSAMLSSTCRQLLSQTPNSFEFALYHNIPNAEFDIYYQSIRNNISSTVLKPSRLLNYPATGSIIKNFYIFSKLEIMTIATTLEQNLVDIKFQPGLIGIEAGMVNGKLTCVNVIPNTQSARYFNVLNNSEIISVGGYRVLTIEEFRSRVVEMQSHKHIMIKILVSSESRKQIDKISTALSDKTKSVKSTLLNVFGDKLSLIQSRNTTPSHDNDQSHLAPRSSRNLDFASPRKTESNKWDFSTAVEDTDHDSTTFLKIVCLPKEFSVPMESSSNKKSKFQIINNSKSWNVIVYWVDDESCLVYRERLSTGVKHTEYYSNSHIWAIIATPNQFNLNIDWKYIPDMKTSHVLFYRNDHVMDSSSFVDYVWSPSKSSFSISCRRVFTRNLANQFSHIYYIID